MRILSIRPNLTFKSNEPIDKTPKSFQVDVPKLMGVCGEELAQRDAFIRTGATLDVVRLKNLGIDNFRLVDSKSVRGQSLTAKPQQLFQELKESGIETVIDLRREGSPTSQYARKCEAAGLRYMHFQTNDSFPAFNCRGSNKISCDEFAKLMDGYTNQMVDFFDEMSNGRVYIGCLLGLHRTDMAVAMNYLLNPVEPESPPFLSHMFIKEEPNLTGKRIGSAKNLLRNLTEEHRLKLGLPEGFNDIFDVRIAKLKIMNMFIK